MLTVSEVDGTATQKEAAQGEDDFLSILNAKSFGAGKSAEGDQDDEMWNSFSNVISEVYY